MKRFILTFWFCLGLMGFIFAQSGAVIAFGEEHFDFKSIREADGPVSHVFEFTNKGSGVLVIQNVKASCGCTTPDWTKSPVPPGGKGFVKATFDPAGRPGLFSKTITVSSNAVNTPSMELNFKGTVLAKTPSILDQYGMKMGDLRFISTHLGFRNLTPESVKTDTLSFMNNGKASIKIGFANVPAFLKVVAIPANIPPSGKGKILVTYYAAKRNGWGLLSDAFYLTLNQKQDISQKITITGIIEEDFSKLTPQQRANPTHISFDNSTFGFGTIKAGEKPKGILTFHNTGKSTLFIRKIETGWNCTTATATALSVEPGGKAYIQIQFDSNGKKDEQNKYITITTNDPDHTRTILYVKGTVQ